ncbi:unnamed protein product, partial [Mesorhabditis spiculigera]
MVLRRLLLGSIISSLYLVVGQTITCYNCTSSRTCSPSKDVCTATACYIVTEDNYMASGCATDAVTFTVNNTNVAGLCYRPDNITRVCACHTASCNTRLDSDAFPDVNMTILQSLNISSLMEYIDFGLDRPATSGDASVGCDDWRPGNHDKSRTTQRSY